MLFANYHHFKWIYSPKRAPTQRNIRCHKRRARLSVVRSAGNRRANSYHFSSWYSRCGPSLFCRFIWYALARPYLTMRMRMLASHHLAAILEYLNVIDKRLVAKLDNWRAHSSTTGPISSTFIRESVRLWFGEKQTTRHRPRSRSAIKRSPSFKFPAGTSGWRAAKSLSKNIDACILGIM